MPALPVTLADRWSAIAGRLRVWEYSVTFGESANLPLPNLEILAADIAAAARTVVAGDQRHFIACPEDGEFVFPNGFTRSARDEVAFEDVQERRVIWWHNR